MANFLKSLFALIQGVCKKGPVETPDTELFAAAVDSPQADSKDLTSLCNGYSISTTADNVAMHSAVIAGDTLSMETSTSMNDNTLHHNTLAKSPLSNTRRIFKMSGYIAVLTLITTLLFATVCSCVKQKNCEGGYTGKFVYLKETYTMQGKSCPQAQKKIVGHFFFGEDVTKDPLRIYGYVPPKFRSGDSVSVKLSYKSHCDGKITLDIWGPEIFFLTCIEAESL